MLVVVLVVELVVLVVFEFECLGRGRSLGWEIKIFGWQI